MRKLFNGISGVIKDYSCLVRTSLKKEDGFGRDEILGTAAVLIIAAFITIPQLRTFVTTVIAALNSWWTNTISTRVFPAS